MSEFKAPSQNYYLDIKFGAAKASSIPLIGSINPIDELIIVQDINRFLPTFRLKFQDIKGLYSNLIPFDSRMNKIQITFNRSGNGINATVFDFDVCRRFPTSDFVCDIEGILRVNNFFKSSKIRGFSDSLRDNIAMIAQNELEVEEVDISSSLDFKKDFIQPDWTNAELLTYLKDNLIGVNNEAAYFCFITCKKTVNGMKRTLVFKSLKEFYTQKVKYTFSDTPEITVDSEKGEVYYPIFDSKVYDNGKMIETSGLKRLDYSYFNYDTSIYEIQNIKVEGNVVKEDNYYSLTEDYLIDKNSSEDNLRISDTGRSNNFTTNFKGRVKNSFYKRINSLSKIWISSLGLEDIIPGDIVRLQFFRDLDNVVGHQNHGFWMVERVVHTLGVIFGTRLLLTRNGLNTSQDTMLVSGEVNRKKD